MRTAAAQAFAVMGKTGKAAVPNLIECLKDEDIHVRGTAIWALNKMEGESVTAIEALLPFLDDQELDFRRAAADCFRSMGAAAKLAVPSLILTLKRDHDKPGVRTRVAWALYTIGLDGKEGAEIVDVAFDIMKISKSWDESMHMAQLLAAGGSAALPKLGEGLKDANPKFGEKCARSICMMEKRKKGSAIGALPALMEAVKTDPKGGVGRYCAAALGLLGNEAKSALPVLVNMIKDTEGEGENLSYAAEALAQVDPASLLLLLQEIRDANSNLRIIMLRAVGYFGEAAKPAIKELCKLLKDEDKRVVCAAADTLGKLGAVAKEARPDLQEVLKTLNKHDLPYRAVTDALKKIGD